MWSYSCCVFRILFLYGQLIRLHCSGYITNAWPNDWRSHLLDNLYFPQTMGTGNSSPFSDLSLLRHLPIGECSTNFSWVSITTTSTRKGWTQDNGMRLIGGFVFCCLDFSFVLFWFGLGFAHEIHSRDTAKRCNLNQVPEGKPLLLLPLKLPGNLSPYSPRFRYKQS